MPLPRLMVTGSGRASGSTFPPGPSRGRPNDTSRPTAVVAPVGDFLLDEQLHIVQEVLRLALENLQRGRRHLVVELRQPVLRVLQEPVGILQRRPALLVADLAQERRVHVVQLGTARERIEPDIAVALALVHGVQPEAALEEEAERALGRFLEFGDRVDVVRRARVKRRSCLRHVAVELGECRAVALPFRQAPARDVRERRIDSVRPVFASAGDGAKPPRGRGEPRVAIGRHRGPRYAERLLHLLVRECLVSLLQPVGLQHQPRGERLAELARVAAGVAEGGVRARDCEPSQHPVHRFIHAVGRALQVVRDPRPFLVQQHGVLRRTSEHTPFLDRARR